MKKPEIDKDEEQARCFKIIFGKRMKLLRRLKKWSQMDLAFRLGYSSSGTLSLIERGEREMDREKMLQVAEIFGVHPAVMLSPHEMDDEDLQMVIDLMSVIKKKYKSPHYRSIQRLLKDTSGD